MMRKYQPSQVDWPAIRARVESGEGYTSIAKDYEVSRQAIQKRCKREEWLHGKERTMAVRRELRKRNQVAQPVQPVQPEAQPETVALAQPSQPLVLREDKRAAIIELLGDGVPKIHAAAVAGVSDATLHRWISEDEAFKRKVRAAESAAVALRVQRIGKAGQKDWRADSWYLERTQKATFGSDAGKGGGVAVQINIVRSDEPEVVNVTPGS